MEGNKNWWNNVDPGLANTGMSMLQLRPSLFQLDLNNLNCLTLFGQPNLDSLDLIKSINSI